MSRVIWPPGVGLKKCAFILDEGKTFSQTRGGQPLITVSRPPMWKIEGSCPPLTREKIARMRGFFGALSLPGATFLATDVGQRIPQAHSAGGLPAGFSGACRIARMNSSGLTLRDVPNGLTLNPGDYVGLIENSKYGLYLITEGGVVRRRRVTIKIVPEINMTLFTLGATVQVKEPTAEFYLEPGSAKIQHAYPPAPIEFRAFQKIY